MIPPDTTTITPVWVYTNPTEGFVVRFVGTREPEEPKPPDDGVDREEGD